MESHQPEPFNPRRRRWSPVKNREPALEAYIQAVSEGVQAESSRKRRDNLTRDERTALRTLKQRISNSEVVIKPADKGSAKVVWSYSDYVTEVRRQLHNTSHYQPLESDPTTQYTTEINFLLLQMKERGSISEDTQKYLTQLVTRPARFYLLPKIHKPRNPGRPIIASCQAPTEKISEFVDHHLRPLVQATPSYIKDTTDFLLKLKSLNNLPNDILLVTLDVSSLYTNIPHEEGIAACVSALNSRDIQQPPTADLVELISVILKRNNFVFGDQHYLQIHGTAMGTRMAPSYANLFMAQLENELLANTSTKPLVWWRYIDDIFTIWSHRETTLKQFVEYLNHAHSTIKFTTEWSNESVPFLDTHVSLTEGHLSTDLFVKPTDTHQFLRVDSCHPRYCKAAIPFSQALRMRRICSSNEDYHKRTTALKVHLIGCGYEPSFVQEQINRASLIKREDALTPRTKNTNKRVPLVVTYHLGLPNLPSIIKNNFPVLHASNHLKKAIPEHPFVAYRRPKNLRDLLISSKLKPDFFKPARGSSPCGSKRCLTCNYVHMDTIIRSTPLGRSSMYELLPLARPRI